MEDEERDELGRSDEGYLLAPDGLVGPTGRSYWVVEGRLAAGGYPGRHGEEMIGQLMDEGITAFVNLTEDHPGGRHMDWELERYDDRVGTAVVERLEIEDMGIPESASQMKEILDSIDGHLEAGGVVYVHCMGGSGRTGMVVGCWLLRHGLAERDMVLDTVQQLRLQGDMGKGDSPTPRTGQQRQFVREWPEGNDAPGQGISGSASNDAMDGCRSLADPGLEGPSTRSYWVVEGSLLAGAYPGKKMSGETGGRPEVTQQLLDAGVDLFVNLTDDMPGGGDRLSRYDPHVEDLADIIRLPITDLDTPTVDHMVHILDTIDERLADGRTVYVHCWGGFGRTGMVVGCWLRRHGYATAETVQDTVDQLRLGAVDGQHRESPEMYDQRKLIVDWHEGPA
ncbi:MAG: hypothetical protein FI709_11865 [SAR202 cluster bacterium]|jgi:protein-tyrosine phosphatase|nr:hypothetical protein [SAR202 cluster bacterium]